MNKSLHHELNGGVLALRAIPVPEVITMAGGWGCPHELNEICQHVQNRPCDPGMKGCVLAGRFRFSNEAKNRPPRPVRRSDGGKPEPGRS